MSMYSLHCGDCVEWLRSLPSESVDLIQFEERHPLTDRATRERFSAKVAIGNTPEHLPGVGVCHVWTAALNAKGYGHFAAEGKIRRAHIVAWEIVNVRRVPSGCVVMHICDNRACVNPDHLRVGTAMDNTQDMIAKGRKRYPTGDDSGRRKHPSVFPVGEKCVQSKLTELDVRSIRNEQRSSRAVAVEFGVSHSAVLAVRRRETWRHVQ